MEKRRNRLWLAGAGALAACGAAEACTPALQGTRLESPLFVLVYKQAPPIEVGKHFALDLAACPKDGKSVIKTLKVDAHMPEHRHGMNYAPSLKPLGPGRWRAEGLMFHMPGRWEFVFELDAAGKTDRLAAPYQLN